MINIFKKLGAVLVLPILLTGCFGGGDEPSADDPGSGFAVYEGADFEITIPANWEVLEKGNFTSNVPANTVVGFRNNIKNEIFTANVNISRDTVPEPISAEDFGKSTSAKQKTRLVAYQEISAQNTELTNNENPIPAYLIESEGKRSPSDPIVHFKQLFVTTETDVFVITATYLPNEEETVVNSIGEMLNSFALR